MIARWEKGRPLHVAAGRKRWLRSGLIDLMGDDRVNQVRRGQRSVRRRPYTDRFHWSLHSFVDHIVVLPAAIFLFLVSYPLPLLLPPASILILRFRLLAIPLDAIVQLPIALHLLLPVGQRCRLVLLLDRRVQLGLPTLEVHLLLSLDLLLLLLSDCCRRRSSVMLLLSCSNGRHMLLMLLVLLLLLGSGRCCCSRDGLLLLVVDLDHRGRMVPDVVMGRWRRRWLLLLLLLLLFGDRRSLLVLVRYRQRLLLYGEVNQRGKSVVS